MSNKLLPLYRSVLKAAHLVCDEEGFIKKIQGKKKEPWLIGGKSVVLPTDEHLKSGSDATVVFHPLFEYLTRGESEVVLEYRRTVTERLHLSFLALATQLLTIAGSQQQHAQLTPEQSEFLSFVPEADAKMLENFEALTNAMPLGQNQKSFVSMYLKRGGSLEGKTAHRMAVVTFPLYKQLVEDGQNREAEMTARKNKPKPKDGTKAPKLDPVPNSTYGVDLRQVDREAFIKLFEYMLPNLQTPDSYSAISNSNIAPSMDALMHAVQNLAGPLNDLVDRFKNRLSEPAQIILRVEDGWVPDFVNLAPLQVEIRMIPMQAGNDGATVPGKVTNSVEAEAHGNLEAPAPVMGTPVPMTQVPGTPYVAEAPAAAEEVADEAAPSGFRLPPKRPQVIQPPRPTYAGVAPGQAPVQAPVQYPPYQAPGGYPPPGGYPDPRQQPYIPPHHQPPAPQHHQGAQGGGHGVDFQQLLRTQPGLAAAVGPMPGSPVQYAQQQDQPSWATGSYGTQRSQYVDPRQQAYGGGQPYNPHDPYQQKF